MKTEEKLRQPNRITSKKQNDVCNEAQSLLQAVSEGHLNERADVESFQGKDCEVLQALNGILEAVSGPIGIVASHLDQLGKGEVPAKITDDFKGDFNTLKNDLNACVDGLVGLVAIDRVLQRMAVNDCTTQVEGSYVGIFADVAKATNLVQERINNTVRILKNIAIGDYKKDFEALKSVGRRSENDELVPSMVQMMGSVGAMVKDVETLAEEAVNGKLATRVDTSKHQGEYRKVVEGVNETLNAVVAPIQEAGAVLQRIAGGDLTARSEGNYKGDHARMKNDINAMAEKLSGPAWARSE